MAVVLVLRQMTIVGSVALYHIPVLPDQCLNKFRLGELMFLSRSGLTRISFLELLGEFLYV